VRLGAGLHPLSGEGLLDSLEQTFSPAEARRKLDTAIRWGRYAGLFSYDDERGEFRLRSPKEAS
jgi:NitT/TauT family transport system ATP-binding protein